MKRKKNVWIHVMTIYLNMRINVITIVQWEHIEYFKIEIYVQLKFQKIITLILIIYSKNVIIHAKNVVNQEMNQNQ